jgi:hypothetical protein
MYTHTTHAHAHAHVHYTCTCTHTHTHARTQHAHVHKHAHAHTHIHKHTHIQTRTCMHAQAQTQTHTCTHANTAVIERYYLETHCLGDHDASCASLPQSYEPIFLTWWSFTARRCNSVGVRGRSGSGRRRACWWESLWHILARPAKHKHLSIISDCNIEDFKSSLLNGNLMHYLWARRGIRNGFFLRCLFCVQPLRGHLHNAVPLLRTRWQSAEASIARQKCC